MHLRRPVADGTPCQVQGLLLQTWLGKARDPETEMLEWSEAGPGLGINRLIKYCGVFPRAPEEEARAEVPTVDDLMDTAIDNYASMHENDEDAKIELELVVQCKVASMISGKQAQRGFKKRASKTAIIVKIKDDGSKKRRLIVDLKRSGKNALGYVAERVVFPRLADAVWMPRVRVEHF